MRWQWIGEYDQRYVDITGADLSELGGLLLSDKVQAEHSGGSKGQEHAPVHK